MVDITEIKKVAQVTDADRAQDYLDTGSWVILSIANGQEPDCSAYQLFALGSLDPNAKEPPLRNRNVKYS